MICIDTSKWMTGDNSHMFKEQAEAIELYCTQKFKVFDRHLIGFVAACLLFIYLLFFFFLVSSGDCHRHMWNE